MVGLRTLAADIFFIFLLTGSLACNPTQNSTTNAIPASPRPFLPSIAATNSTKETMNTTTTRASEDEEDSVICHNNDSDSNVTWNTYDHIIVSGLPFQRGESHGRQAKDKILKMISYYKASPSMPLWNDCINFVQANYFQAIEQYYPNGLEEMRGIAAGAGVTLEDILILNSRYELARWKRSEAIKNSANRISRIAKPSSSFPECQVSRNESKSVNSEDNLISEAGAGGANECTGAVALSSSTKYAHVLLGQNWDVNEFILKNDTAILLEVHPDPCENIKPFVMLTEAGQLGRSGMSSHGLGVVAMGLWSSDDTFQRSSGPGWIPITLLRRMFLESPNFSVGLRTIIRAPRHVSNNLIIATAEDEALNIELTPNDHFITQVPLTKEFLAHSNHFKSLPFLTQNKIHEGSRGSTSLFRDRRVEKHFTSSWPRISEETFQTAFKDHVGHPNSVCAHSVGKEMAWTSASPNETTVASIIFNLSQRTLQLSKGPPCTEKYKYYCFKFSQL